MATYESNCHITPHNFDKNNIYRNIYGNFNAGLLVFKPVILQFNKALSSFIVFAVEIIPSYFDLNKKVTILDLLLVIFLDFIFIVL